MYSSRFIVLHQALLTFNEHHGMMDVKEYDMSTLDGMEEIVAAHSAITFIDGARGELRYRGYPIGEESLLANPDSCPADGVHLTFPDCGLT